MRFVLSFLGLIIFGQAALLGQAEPARSLSLADCIRLATGQSPEAKIAQKSYEAVYWSYKSYRAGLLPQVRLDLSAPGLVRSIVQIPQDDGTLNFVQQNTGYTAANLSITQAIAPTGGQLTLSSEMNRIDVFGSNASTQYQSTPLLIGLRQPLFAYNEQKWNKRIQPMRFKLAEKRYLEALEQIAIDISGKYFDVYIAQFRVENAEFNREVNDSIFFISKGRYRVGKIAENDLLQTELASLNAMADFKSAEVSLEKARLDLAISLGFRDGSTLIVIPPLEVPIVDVNVDFAIAQARNNRSDLVDYDVRGLEAESAVAQARAGSRFQANINAQFGLNGSSQALSQAYSGLLDREVVSVGLGVPILQWGRGKAAMESALVEQQRVSEQIRLDRRRLERDVRFQILDFLQLQDQVRLSAKADTIAQRRYLVSKNRYLIGKIDITNLQIAQTEKDNARMSYLQTLKSFWMACYQLRRSTLYDFIEDMPLVAPVLQVD